MVMKEIRLIIFDLDGTLVDAYPAIISSFNHTMQSLHYRRQSPRTICRAVGWGDANLLRPFIKEKDLNKALSIYRRHHKTSLIRYSRLLPSAEKLLTYLKSRGYKLSVASNRPTRFSWILIHHLGLEKYFDYVLCADKLKHGKPHPEILKRIMQKFSSLPRQTLYIGDMAIDAQAARRAKVKTIIVTTGSSTKREIRKEKPYRIIGSIRALLKIL
jgi:phosphoglycolate phosphatase